MLTITFEGVENEKKMKLSNVNSATSNSDDLWANNIENAEFVLSSSSCRDAIRISLTLSRHSSLSFIASGRSTGLHPVSSQSCCM